MQKRWWIGGVGVLAVAAVAAVLVMSQGGLGPKMAWSKNAKDGKDGKPEVTLEFLQREVVQPTLASLPVHVEFSGPLVAPQTAVVRAKAAGTLLALNVAEGSRIKAGQAIGVVDLAEMSSRINERSAMLESARAQLAQAERTHASNQRLADQQFISPIALENSRAAVDTARAQLQASQAQVATARVGLRDAALVAPISGVVAKRHVVAGEKLSPEQQVLTIVDLAKLELAGSVGTHEVSQLSVGMLVQVNVEGHDAPVAGRIARIAPAAETGTRSIGVTVEVANPGEKFRAGQYALARVTLADPSQRLTLPAAAVGGTSGQAHVWAIESGVLMRRAVSTGRRDEREGRVEVTQGVTAASTVLAARFDNLREGAKAVVVAAKSAPVASAAASSSLKP